MKIRNGFVSNSSSSSFVLFKNYLTKEQMQHIRDWKIFPLTDEYKKILEEYAKTHYIEPHNEWTYDYSSADQKEKIKVEPFSPHDYAYYPFDWDVQETFNTFDISTTMDNYNMKQYLETLGIDIKKCGIIAEDGHDDVFGLNDFETDMRDYLNDPDYYSNYTDKYWRTSDYYKNKFYPEFKDSSCPPPKPLEKKKWICEDAGKALREAEHKIKELARKNGCYFLEKMKNDQYYNDKCRIYAEVIDVIKEVEDNWQAVDEYEENTMEDDSQRVMAALEGQGYFNKEDEETYRESVDKLYDRPLGVNVLDIIEEN